MLPALRRWLARDGRLRLRLSARGAPARRRAGASTPTNTTANTRCCRPSQPAPHPPLRPPPHSWDVVKTYFLAGGNIWTFSFIILLFTVEQGARAYTDRWVGIWFGGVYQQVRHGTLIWV